MDFVDQAKAQWQEAETEAKENANHQELLDTIIAGQRAQVQAIVGLAGVISKHQPRVTIKHPVTSVATPDVRPILSELRTLVDLERKEKDPIAEPVVEAIKSLIPVLEAIPKAIEVPEPTEEVVVTNLSELKASLDAILKQLKTANKVEPTVVPAPEVFVDAPDFAPLLATFTEGLARVEAAIKAIPQPVDDDTAVLEAVNGTTSAIQSLRFPIPNVITDPLIRYKVADVDDTGTVKYYGMVANDGGWLVMKEDDTANPKTFRYATASGSYPSNWTNRASLTYDYLYTALNG
jgi:hypothetical protein